MLGDVPASQGNADPYTLTDVDIWEEPEIPTEVAQPELVPEIETKTEMITQEEEPTVAVPKKEEKPKANEKTMVFSAARLEKTCMLQTTIKS